MKFANIEVFKNGIGTVTIREDDNLDDCYIYFPIELIPTLIDCLNIIYKDSNGKSEILEDDDE